MNKGDLVESFLEMAVYLTFTHLIPNEILHVYLPEKRVGMTYQDIHLRHGMVQCFHNILRKFMLYLLDLWNFVIRISNAAG